MQTAPSRPTAARAPWARTSRHRLFTCHLSLQQHLTTYPQQIVYFLRTQGLCFHLCSQTLGDAGVEGGPFTDAVVPDSEGTQRALQATATKQGLLQRFVRGDAAGGVYLQISSAEEEAVAAALGRRGKDIPLLVRSPARMPACLAHLIIAWLQPARGCVPYNLALANVQTLEHESRNNMASGYHCSTRKLQIHLLVPLLLCRFFLRVALVPVMHCMHWPFRAPNQGSCG